MTYPAYEHLIKTGHAFFDALAARDPSRLPLAADCRFTENCLDTAIGEGLWRSVTDIGFRQVFADSGAGQVGVFATFDEAAEKGCFAARLAVDAGEISEIETIVARKGEASVLNPDALVSPNPIFEERNSGSSAPSRHWLMIVANRYFSALEDDHTQYVDFHPECQRIENGVQTTSQPRMGNLNIREQIDQKFFAYIRHVRERRFPLIDTERGLVLGIAFLDVRGDTTIEVDGAMREMPPHARTPRSTLLFELFKISEGLKIRWIEAMMVNTPYGTPSGWYGVPPTRRR
ncbi:MAG: hypothetical protein AB7N24_05705 [Dehalococcoidia bacterium]